MRAWWSVAPPNHDVTVVGDRLRLVEPAERLGPSPSIDLLFESLAEHGATRAMAVVLSGTGSDGARGLRRCAGAGGLTMVQSPESARFDGMPRAAMALGRRRPGRRCGDAGRAGWPCCPPEWRGGRGAPASPTLDALPSITTQLQAVDRDRLLRVTSSRPSSGRSSDGWPSGRSTTSTRTSPCSLADPDEAHALSATCSSRSRPSSVIPEAFDALRLELARYLDGPRPTRCCASGCPGCATGEEVYSIAMLVSDILGNPADLAQRLKIFGTDLDEASLAVARRAVYPAVGAARIPRQSARRLHQGGRGRLPDRRGPARVHGVRPARRRHRSALPAHRPDLLPQHPHLLHRAPPAARRRPCSASR